MKSNKHYFGKYTFCGTYAVLNAIQSNISPEIFELTTGVPFGIRCVDMKSERLLTPYKNPNYGIDYALNLWGIRSKKVENENKEEIFRLLCGDLEKKDNMIVIGPTDMGKLFYIPLCNIYEGVDHYIYIQKANDSKLIIMDSEGYISFPISYNDLFKMWSIHGVYEAQGKYTYRCLEKIVRVIPEKDISRHILNLICKNMEEAENEGQGSSAIISAYNLLQKNSMQKWRLSVLFELESLIQRKMLMNYYMELFWDNETEIFGILKNQIYITSQIFHDIEIERKISKEKFVKLSCEEKRLMLCCKKLLS